MKSDATVMLEAQLSVLVEASTAQGPFDDVNLKVPAAEPGVGRKVAQVCCDQVPFERMHPTLAPVEVKTWIVPLSSVEVGDCVKQEHRVEGSGGECLQRRPK